MQTLTRPTEANRIVRTAPAGETIEVGQFIGSVERLHRGPQAFSSTFEPGYQIDAHFHLGDQFQIFVEGESTIGNHAIDPVSVHYSDAYTAYGPIVCGAEGLTFFNFRGRCDIGSEYMPESRKGMAIRGGRSLTAHCELGLGQPVRTMRMETLIELADDDLAAYEYLLAPGARMPQDIAAGNGRFQLVLDGELETGGETLPRHTVGCVPAGERFSPRRAGEAGAHVLEVQFPKE
jgi:hypothetical protein